MITNFTHVGSAGTLSACIYQVVNDSRWHMRIFELVPPAPIVVKTSFIYGDMAFALDKTREFLALEEGKRQ
jgi:hypothetical protein